MDSLKIRQDSPELNGTQNGDGRTNAEQMEVNENPIPPAAKIRPLDELERTLAEIWRKVLHLETVGVHDDFFDIGGHSLLAMRILPQITTLLKVQVPLRWFFEYRTIESLARQIATEGGKREVFVPMEKAERSEARPMSFGQEGMWLLQQTLPDAATYNEPVGYRLRGPVDVERLRKSLRAIAIRHEVMRTALILEGEAFVQRITAAEEFELPWEKKDLRSLPASDRMAAAERCMADSVRQPFDLAKAPVWRVLWLTVGEDDHLLMLTFHHCIVDAWSLRLILNEFERLYAANGDPGKAGLSELTLQYADYAAWQRQRLAGRRLEKLRAYWHEQVNGLPTALELPVDGPRPRQPSGRGAIYRFKLKEPLAEALRELAKKEGTSLFGLMLATFQTWLFRYTGQNDFVVSTPVADRKRPEVQALVGYFLNTLPLRTRLEGSLSFREFLAQSRKTFRGGLEHAALPFDHIVKMAGTGADGSRPNLNQVMFVVLDQGTPMLRLEKIVGAPHPMHTGTSKCDLLLYITTEGAVWDCELEYATDLFRAETVARMATCFEELLHSIIANPDEEIGRLNLLPANERHRLLVEWNATEQKYPEDPCVHQLFEAQAERTPDAIAVEFGNQSLTYRALNRRANQLAHELRARGVGPDVPVAFCLERSQEMVVGLLGILKAGGAYVPLDPAHPQERLNFLLTSTKAPVLVTHATWLKRFSSSQAVLGVENVPSDTPEENPAVSVSPKNLAYILYTSGSTGQPKGVAMEHAPLVNLIRWQLKQTGFAPRTLQFASTSFDVSFQEMFSTWSAGGTLVLVDPQSRADPAALWEFVAERKLERVFLPVVMLQHLAEAAALSSRKAPDMREVITAGEQLRITPAIRALFAGQAGRRLHNHYGPTETHVVTGWTLPPNPADWPEFPPIGRPIANTKIYLLDAQMNPVPPGVPGELYVGGAALARGYWQDPVRTTERFGRDPFASGENGRIYRTGDLARYRPDDDIQYLGRLDQQVKIRGHRVELGEIEAVLGTHPSVSACAAIAQQDQTGEKSLTAFVVLRDGMELPTNTLREWLGEKLPGYMIPSRCVALDALPLTPNGKTDRKALEKLKGNDRASGREFAAPRTELESRLAAIWCKLLDQERVGINDNFFELGGHSLKAVQLAIQIRTQFHIEMPVRRVFDFPTISQLAGQLKEAVRSDTPRLPVSRDKTIPLSFAQEHLWFLAEYDRGGVTNDIPQAYRLAGPINAEMLRRALGEIISRHESLRTTFRSHNGQVEQVITPPSDFSLPVLDLSGLPQTQRETEVQRIMAEKLRSPFDLAVGPLIWAVLIRLGAEEHILLVNMHHTISDGWSLGIFNRELSSFYAAFVSGQNPSVPPLAIQYSDYTAWQRERLQGKELEKRLNYWCKQLAGAPTLELPTDRSRPAQLMDAGAFFEMTFPRESGRRLNDFNREMGVTPFMSLLAVFQVLLSRYSGLEDIVVGTPVANRQRAEEENLIGFFVNMLVMRGDLSGNPCFRELVNRGRETALEAYQHQDLPFKELVKVMNPVRELNRHPLFQVVFALQNAPEHPLDLAGVTSSNFLWENVSTSFDVQLHLWQRGGSWSGYWVYKTGLFEAKTIERMAGHFLTLLENLLNEPERPVSLVSMLPPEERQQLLVEWNSTDTDFPVKCVHELFEEQVERNPNAAAVVFGENVLTYRQLDIRANELAQQLRQRGAGPDTVVGLSVERSLEMVVALLGILKAGGAYWGLEDNLPEERLQFMLSDARPRVLVMRRNAIQRVLTIAERMPGDRPIVVAIEDLLESRPAEALPRSPLPTAEHPAYVSYTSGSMGRPKGVLVPHRGVVRLVKNTNYIDLKPDDVLLHLSPLAFDASTFEIWGALLNGGRVVLLPPGPPDLEEISEVIRRDGVTTAWLTAGLFHLMVEQCLDGLKPLRNLLAGGDVLLPQTVRKARQALSGCRIINGYGPTENTTFTCCHTIVEEDDAAPSVPIGRPISNTQVYVLDAQLQPVPIGVAGELYAGGSGVALGYLNQPRLTAERFIPDPFRPVKGALLYRTGDSVRRRADGNIEFLGRMDQQVKIRGYRVETGEIEMALASYPAVKNCAVVAQSRETGEKYLTAFVVTREGTSWTAESLREWLGPKIPKYMIPSQFAQLATLPLTGNGKVDRKALDRIESAGPVKVKEYVAPRTELESQLAAIWCKLLNKERVGVTDNFFDLGGHSLQAVQLCTQIEKLLSHKLPIAVLFQAPTVEMLAHRITEENWAPPWSSLVPLQPRGAKPPLFFVHGWGGDVYGFLDVARQMDPDQPVYGLQAVGLDGKVARHTSVEQMAAHYILEIRSFQPEGPYYLAGYSMGGLIAHEMAQQLHRAGQRVAFLGLVDTHPSLLPWPLYLRLYVPPRISYLLGRFGFHLRHWWKLSGNERFNYIRGRWVALKFWLGQNNLSRSPELTSAPEAGPIREAHGRVDYYQMLGSAYRIGRYPGSADLFVCDETRPEIVKLWKRLARGGLLCHRIPGNHHQVLMSGYLSALTESMKKALRHAQNKEQPLQSGGK